MRDEEIRARIAAAEQTMREIDRLSPRQVRGKESETLKRYERAVELAEVGKAELASRRYESVIANAPTRRAYRDHEDERRKKREVRQPVVSALRFVVARAHSELDGVTLAADRLSESEGQELAALVKKARAAVYQEGAEPLSEAETRRYEQLVARAAGDEDLFERKRSEAAARQKLRELEKTRKRHPQAESLVAAVMGDPDVFDLLHERLREEVRVIDEYGHESRGVATESILESEHISTLYIAVALIAENGGREVTIRDNGYIERRREDGRLPFLPIKTLAQLRRNGFLTVRAEGSHRVIGPGPRLRDLASTWGIELECEAAKPIGVRS
jgi:hypothetical protein